MNLGSKVLTVYMLILLHLNKVLLFLYISYSQYREHIGKEICKKLVSFCK